MFHRSDSPCLTQIRLVELKRSTFKYIYIKILSENFFLVGNNSKKERLEYESRRKFFHQTWPIKNGSWESLEFAWIVPILLNSVGFMGLVFIISFCSSIRIVS